MNKLFQIAAILFLFGLLAAIRLFETTLFYDPLLSFFKREYLYGTLPDMELARLMLHTTLRFLLNTGISLLILYLAFSDKSIVKFSAYIYLFAFTILFVWMLIFLWNATPDSNYQILFYVRRFLIQPVFVLLLLPAFYYHKKMKNS